MDGREYPQLPQGIDPWWSKGQVTGSTGSGTMNVRTDFNPASSDTFQPYVAITHIGIRGNVAALTQEAWAFLTMDTWERSAGAQAVLCLMKPARVGPADDFGAAYTGPSLYLGRATKGSLAQIVVGTFEVDTATLDVNMSGLISDKPFVPYDFWRV